MNRLLARLEKLEQALRPEGRLVIFTHYDEREERHSPSGWSPSRSSTPSPRTTTSSLST
jgi:hypothetical protein